MPTSQEREGRSRQPAKQEARFDYSTRATGVQDRGCRPIGVGH